MERDHEDSARISRASLVSHLMSGLAQPGKLLTRSPLMPIVHWPTFSQQLVAREDEKSDTWRAFLLSLGEHKESSNQVTPANPSSDILDHPAPTFRPHISARQGPSSIASKMPYRVASPAEPQVQRCLACRCLDTIVRVSQPWKALACMLTGQLRSHIPWHSRPWPRSQHHSRRSYSPGANH